MLVIERMHSGARRFVVLDFGSQILLTDVMIPACGDLVSLSVDIWSHKEEQDGQRLVVAPDIGVRPLVMNDLQPAPVCRYLKITAIGRYGMNTTRCKIPIGYFYGHNHILPGDTEQTPDDLPALDKTALQSQKNTLQTLLEDCNCRYSLASTRLSALLSPLLTAQRSTTSHMFHFLKKQRLPLSSNTTSEEEQHILAAYQECLLYQQQLNLIRGVLSRLDADNYSKIDDSLQTVSSDKLRVISDNLLETLLGLTVISGTGKVSCAVSKPFSEHVCESLFRDLCVVTPQRTQLLGATLLVRMCGSQLWWGRFLASTLSQLYSTAHSKIFPQDRVFILLTYLGQKSLQGGCGLSMLESVLSTLGDLMRPLTELQGPLDLSLISWLLLFISSCLDHRTNNSSNKHNKEKQAALFTSQWDFIKGEATMKNKPNNNKPSLNRSYRRRLQKYLMMHKQQLEELEAAKKAFEVSAQALASYSEKSGAGVPSNSLTSQLDSVIKHQEELFKLTLKQHSSKHFKDILQIRRGLSSKVQKTAPGAADIQSSKSDIESFEAPLSREQCLSVSQGLATLLLKIDFTCTVDTFLLACKVIAHLCLGSRPALTLGEVFTSQQLLRLVRLAVTTQHQRSSWVTHAVSCLLQDILEGERLYPVLDNSDLSPSDDDTDYLSAEGDDLPATTSPCTNSGSENNPPAEETAEPDSAVAAPTTSTQEGSNLSTVATAAPETNSVALEVLTDCHTATKPMLSAYINTDSEEDSVEDLICEFFEGYKDDLIFESVPPKFKKIHPTVAHGSVLFPKMKVQSQPGHRQVMSKPRGIAELVSSPISTGSFISTALDARLEDGVEILAETRLRVMTNFHSESTLEAISTPIQEAPNEKVPTIVGVAAPSPPSDGVTSLEMLTTTFNQVFSHLRSQVLCPGLEQLLQLWMCVNMGMGSVEATTEGFNASIIPLVPLSLSAVSKLLEALSWHPFVSLRTWCLAFQCLTLMTNQRQEPVIGANGVFEIREHSSFSWMARAIVTDENFLSVLLKFLSGAGMENSENTTKGYVGPNIIQMFHDLIVRLQMRCDVVSLDSGMGDQLKQVLLELVYELVKSSGPIPNQQGPLDAQCKYLEMVLNLSFNSTHSHIAMEVIKAASLLVHRYILSEVQVTCRSTSESGVTASSCFGGLFASVLGGESHQSSPGSRDSLICNVLQLVTQLVQTPLVTPAQVRVVSQSQSTNSQTPSSSFQTPLATSLTDTLKIQQQERAAEPPLTDSTKIERTGISNQQTDEDKAGLQTSQCCHTVTSDLKIPCIADTVLCHPTTMHHMLSALAGCHGSTMAMLLGPGGGAMASTCSNSCATSENASHNGGAVEKLVLAEPISVGDRIFQFLAMLNTKTTSLRLILKPLVDFFKSDESSFVNGPYPLSEPLLWLILRVLDCEPALQEFNNLGGIKIICENLIESNSWVMNTNPSLVSLVMQHMCQVQRSEPPKKSTDQTNSSNSGLINWASYGTISSSNPTAQPADVLMQSGLPHRRARTAAWTYHFYPNETWVDLTITLPCAILLREVQLQPHLTSLSTCPSAVALEVQRESVVGMTPLSLPLPTSGLTFIRLQLSKPEIVTAVLVRLYRPRDSSNIGLSQIQVLGSTAFGESLSRLHPAADFCNEDQVARSSLGWLRLLHHCLTLPNMSTEMESVLLNSAVEPPGLLSRCCALLSTHMLGHYTSHLERVILKLGLHSLNLGLEVIHTLLDVQSANLRQELVVSSGTSTSVTSNSVSEVLYQLYSTQDIHTTARINALLSWLLGVLEQQQRSDTNSWLGQEDIPVTQVQPSHVHCIASILWSLKSSPITQNIGTIITTDFIKSLYRWSLNVPSDSSLHRCVCFLLCSICHLCPEKFQLILQWIGVLVPLSGSGETRPLTDDVKDREAEFQARMTDDCKQESLSSTSPRLILQDLYKIELRRSHLSLLSFVCQSPEAISQLIASRFPHALVQGILEFCSTQLTSREELPTEATTNPTNVANSHGLTDADKAEQWSNNDKHLRAVSANMVVDILKFFAEACWEGDLRDWLGTPEGRIFWLPLISLLCDVRQGDPTSRHCETWSQLEDAVLTFLSRCCWCHPDNQSHLATLIGEILQRHGHRQSGENLENLPGFTRRLVLQMVLENEKVFVLVRATSPLSQPTVGMPSPSPPHPLCGDGHRFRLVYLSTSTTCGELAKQLTDPSSLWPLLSEANSGNGISKDCRKKDLHEISLELVDELSIAAGVTAKDKRLKDSKNVATKGSKKGKAGATALSAVSMSKSIIQHDLIRGRDIPPSMTLGQLITALQERGSTLHSPLITITLVHSLKKDDSGGTDKCEASEDPLLSIGSFPSTLQLLASQGGLALLAPLLPLLYPDAMMRLGGVGPRMDWVPVDNTESDWVKVDPNDEFYDHDYLEFLPFGNNSPTSGKSHLLPSPSIPPHSLAAFSLFLRLPGYADYLMRDRRKAQCLLRLALGVTDDGDGGDILTSTVASSLPTLPFRVLQSLLESAPLTTDDGMLLRRTALDVGALHLLLACLAVFTHQESNITLPGLHHELVVAITRAISGSKESMLRSDDKSHLYWAKGTGFGTGSTTQSWNMEQALMKQRNQEEHITCLVLVLSTYIHPSGEEVFQDSSSLPALAVDLLRTSCLLPAISSYLRNDSVLDMARHIPLYRSLLQLLRSIAVCPQLRPLLLPSSSDDDSHVDPSLSVAALLFKMKECVNTYTSRLKPSKIENGNADKTDSKIKAAEIAERDEGLAQLIPDIKNTALIVEQATRKLTNTSDLLLNTVHSANSITDVSSKNLEARYIEIMKKLQFDTYEMLVENEESGYRFVISHHFEASVRASETQCHPTRVKRLAQEAVTLSTSLPLSYSSSVFVRCDQDRLDIMKVLITGPSDTPYANGCFEFDVYFPPDYPNSPMSINLETTGHHTVRFNPNLYNDGKVCLSVLNTWHGRPEEKWNPHTSSFLQVLVSIQSLILVADPYFNEPGYERSRGTPTGIQSSLEYDSNIRQATAKWAILEQIRNPCPCFKDIIHKHFWLKKTELLHQLEGWITEMENFVGEKRTSRTVSINTIALKRHVAQIKEELNQMVAPEGLEDLVEEAKVTPPSPPPSVPVTHIGSIPQSELPPPNTENSPQFFTINHQELSSTSEDSSQGSDSDIPVTV